MKTSHKLSDAVHILTYIVVVQDGDLSSAAIADSVASNQSLIRRLMSQLRQAGLLQTSPGKVAPKLAKPATAITLLDVYKAINPEGQRELLHVDPKTNIRCPVGANIQATLDGAYRQVQLAAEREMQAITLQQIIDDLVTRVDQPQQAWLAALKPEQH